MKYSEWETSVPQHTREDPIWRWTVYRLARFAGAIAWADVSKLNKDRRTQRVADQLYRSIGSIAANLSEGYSRSSGAVQAQTVPVSSSMRSAPHARRVSGTIWASRFSATKSSPTASISSTKLSAFSLPCCLTNANYNSKRTRLSTIPQSTHQPIFDF
ncbi:MAG: four helix bundle protein [Caldilineaceae bacterium]|nr:four helix bundle protein [Caldilineaceae bacterium]